MSCGLNVPSPSLNTEYSPHRESVRVKPSCPPSTCVLHSDPSAVKCQPGSWCVTVCNLAISCWEAFGWPAGALECVSTGTAHVHIQGPVSAGDLFFVCVCVSVGVLRICQQTYSMCWMIAVCKYKSKSGQRWGLYPHATRHFLTWYWDKTQCLYVAWCPAKLDHSQIPHVSDYGHYYQVCQTT